MSDIRDILELEQGASVPSKEAIVGGNKVMNATKEFLFSCVAL